VEEIGPVGLTVSLVSSMLCKREKLAFAGSEKLEFIPSYGTRPPKEIDHKFMASLILRDFYVEALLNCLEHILITH
jgi:hypothetical protein